MNGRMMQRKKKGRLYSLGGNEPPKRAVRGRLDRLKTVGTFDLGSDTVLNEVTSKLNEHKTINTIDENAPGELNKMRRMSANALLVCNDNDGGMSAAAQSMLSHQQQRLSYTPGPCRREIHRSGFAKRLTNQKYAIGSSASSSPASRRFHSSASISTSNSQLNMPMQHSADDCLEKQQTFMEQRKSRSSSTSIIPTKNDTDRKYSSSTQLGTVTYKRSPNKHLPATNFIKKTDYKHRASCSGIQKTAATTATDDDIDKITSQLANISNDDDGDDDDKEHFDETGQNYKSRKPMLRKSKRIVRTDSELFDEDQAHDEIQQTTTTRAQIHNQPSTSSSIDNKYEPNTQIGHYVVDDMQPSTSSMASHDYIAKVDSPAGGSGSGGGGGCIRKNSSDLDESGTPAEMFKSTTTNSSRNISIDEVNTVFSDSTTDLEKMERDYRELARSTLQREYKSDGDTLDEVGKRRNDFQNWKNQSFEANFELCCQQLSPEASGYSERTDQTKDNSIDDKIDMDKRSEHSDILDNHLIIEIMEDLKSKRYPFSPSSQSSEYGAGGSGIEKLAETLTCYSQPDYNSSKENISLRDGYGSAMMSPIKTIDDTSQQLTISPDLGRHETLDITPSPQQQHQQFFQRPSKLDITHSITPEVPVAIGATVTATTAVEKDGKLMSLFEKRLRKFKKINKLLKSKRFNVSALSEKHKTKSVDITTPTSSTSSAQKSTAKAAAAPQAAQTKSDLSSRLFRSRFSPGKSSTSDSKTSVYSSKMSLFSALAHKSSFFPKKSAMFSSASHSNNELNTIRTNSKTKLSEISKSNSEINSYKTSSPMRFSMKRSVKEKKPNSSQCIYTEHQTCHSPLSEEFYNKTGSVRLSAIELYHKFMLEDFVGLYKQEPIDAYDYRKPFSRTKNARLLKQKSEPKFSFGGDPMNYDPREEDEDFYEEEFSELEDEYFYEGEDEYGEDEYDDEDMYDEEEMEMEMEEEKDDEQRAYHSESDVDEIFLMPDTDKCTDYVHYEQYGFENKQFTLEHPMVCKMPCRDHDLSVIDEIPYLDEVPQPQYACVTHQGGDDDDEMLTVYTICTTDDLLTVKEEDDDIDDDDVNDEQIQIKQSIDSDHSIQCAITTYMKGAPPDISVDSSDAKAEKQSCIQRTGSFELLSNSSETIRSGSTLTGYDFDTVKNLNLDSCSTSKLSLSLRSDGFDEFTLTPDEPKILMKNCDVEDFTLTPDASFSEQQPFGMNTTDDLNSGLSTYEPLIKRPIIDDDNDNDDDDDGNGICSTNANDTLSNEVLVIVDKFLANERLLQQNLNIIPIKLKSSPQLSPIDSDASSMNLLLEKQKGTIFNLQSSSSKSTLDETMDLEKLHFDYDYDDDDTNNSTYLDSRTAKKNLINPHIEQQPQRSTDIEYSSKLKTTIIESANADPHLNKKLIKKNSNIEMLNPPLIEKSDNIQSPKDHIPPPIMPSSRLSMQNLQPFFFSDDLTPKKSNAKCTNTDKIVDKKSKKSETIEIDNDCYQKTVTTTTTTTTTTNTNDSSFLQKKILSKLKKNKSQSLGNLNKKTRCFPL